MSIPSPYTKLKISENQNGTVSAEVIMRKYTFGEGSLPTSIVADGEELLMSPMRIVGTEDGEDMIWSVKDSFIFSRSDEELVLCGSMQSERFIVNTSITLSFDGCMNFDLKFMPRGMTVGQVFGMNDVKKYFYNVGSLIFEIPLKKSAELYHFFPNCRITGEKGDLVPYSHTSCSGQLPEGKRFLPHRPLLWLGNEERGLCFFSESDENWQPSDTYRAIEIVDGGDTRLVRLHLLDSHPKKWSQPTHGRAPNYFYRPLSFTFGFEATPIKPFPKKPYLHNALHIDCFCKIEGDYKEYLYGDFDGENGYDRMKRLGVTTLILHEKWNKIQNFPYLSEPTAKQLEVIIKECHARGIKVLPYFGYEIASLSPLWSSRSDEAVMISALGLYDSGWWRVPPQRDYVVCYNSSWQDTFVEGIKTLVEKYGFDGIYLDSTLNVNGCTNARHGCGYLNGEGVRRPTYPLMSNRRLLRRLYEIIEPLGGIINYHSYACCNIPSMGFTHLGWNGESIQMRLLKEGASDLPLDYFRTEYIGRNFGIPQELIAYENRPKWTFEHSCAFGIIHGILPRPNSILSPLDFISPVWKIFDSFPIADSEWVPYWENSEILTGNDDIKCSFYRYRGENGSEKRLVFISNTKSVSNELKLSCDAKFLYGTMDGCGDMPPFSFGIFEA